MQTVGSNCSRISLPRHLADGESAIAEREEVWFWGCEKITVGQRRNKNRKESLYHSIYFTISNIYVKMALWNKDLTCTSSVKECTVCTYTLKKCELAKSI